jgi:hypothetical protein
MTQSKVLEHLSSLGLFVFLSFPQEVVFCLLFWPLDHPFQNFASGHVKCNQEMQ